MTYIVLFDGECHLCQRSVQFIINRDPKMKFKFTSLQGDVGKRLLMAYQTPETTTSLILIKPNRWFDQSSAALHICRHLQGMWKLGYIFMLIPKPIRDVIYNIIARNRYIFGKTKNDCSIQTFEDRQRILKISN